MVIAEISDMYMYSSIQQIFSFSSASKLTQNTSKIDPRKKDKDKQRDRNETTRTANINPANHLPRGRTSFQVVYIFSCNQPSKTTSTDIFVLFSFDRGSNGHTSPLSPNRLSSNTLPIPEIYRHQHQNQSKYHPYKD